MERRHLVEGREAALATRRSDLVKDAIVEGRNSYKAIMKSPLLLQRVYNKEADV